MHGDGRRPLLGREQERAALAVELARASAGNGGLVLVSGEPGIGKSALLEDLAGVGRRQGLRVVWGTCWEGGGAPELWPWHRILGDLDVAADLTSADDPGRFAVLDRVIRLLVEAEPLLVVVDDVQWADQTAVRLLRYAARELRTARVLVAVGARSSSVDGTLRELVADSAVRQHLPLRGLDTAAISAVVADVTGRRPDPAWLAAITNRSGGNPFFVRQLAGLPTARPGEALPTAVDETVAARLAPLEPEVQRALEVAALVGRHFEDVVVAAAADQPLGLRAAVAAGLVEVDGPGTHRFTHDLVREHLVARQSDDTMRRRHATVVHAIESLPDVEMRPSRLAGHAMLAVPALPAAEAVQWCLAAAATAAGLRAYDETARHLRAAARLDPDPLIALDMADALLRSGHRDEARACYERLEAGHRDEPAVRARAAVGLHESGVQIDRDRRQVVQALEGAAATSVDGQLRARVLAALARELSDGPLADQQRAEQLAADALTMARQADDRATLAACLFARHDVVWGPGTAEERVRLGAELAAVARAAGDLGRTFDGLLCRYVALLEAADPTAAVALAQLHGLAEEAGEPYLAYLAGSRQDAWDLMTGTAEEDRLLATYALARRLEVPDAYGVLATQLLTLDLTRQHPGRIVTRHAELGESLMPPDFADEERALELLGRGDLVGARTIVETARPPYDRSMFRWRALAAVAITVEVAHRVGARRACAAAYSTLAPYAGTVVVIGGGVSVLGPVDLYLALCAEAMGDERLAGHVAAATAVARRFGATPWLERLATLQASSTPVFRREGEVWRLGYAGVTVHLPAHKGLADLAVLLSRPGVDVPALELVGAVPQLGSDPVLDDAAKAAYRRRLTELDEAMDATGDPARLETLEAERDQILAELKTAIGLGGRVRRLGDPGERARSTVTARIRDALRRLDDAHPRLAVHLRASVHTGRTCSYRPTDPVSWAL